MARPAIARASKTSTPSLLARKGVYPCGLNPTAPRSLPSAGQVGRSHPGRTRMAAGAFLMYPARAMDLRGAAHQRSRPIGAANIHGMLRILKRLQSPVSQVSMLPRADLPWATTYSRSHLMGVMSAINSVLALDITPAKAKIGPVPKGLRDDWTAIGGDLRVVMRRTQVAIEHDDLEQGSLLGHGASDRS